MRRLVGPRVPVGLVGRFELASLVGPFCRVSTGHCLSAALVVPLPFAGPDRGADRDRRPDERGTRAVTCPGLARRSDGAQVHGPAVVPDDAAAVAGRLPTPVATRSVRTRPGSVFCGYRGKVLGDGELRNFIFCGVRVGWGPRWCAQGREVPRSMAKRT